MCAQLCSLMKAQLLKTYEEVVFRFGGHFDMSLMQACQVQLLSLNKYLFYVSCVIQQIKVPCFVIHVENDKCVIVNHTFIQDSEGAHGETKDILQDDNKENIPVFIAEDIVNENTTTIALGQACILLICCLYMKNLASWFDFKFDK